VKYLITLFLFFTSVQSFAQDTIPEVTGKRFGIGAQIGFYSPADADNGSLLGGIVAQAKFSKHIGAELSLNYRREKYSDGFATVKSWPILISALYYPFDWLYGIAGFGIYSTTFDYPDFTINGTVIGDEDKTEIDFHIGGGLSFPFGSDFRFIGNLRYHFMGYEIKAVEPGQGTRDVNSGYISVIAGVLFEF
jgi:hypothetical protein